MTAPALTMPAYAKLNLFLRVLAREADGFHGIETLFCRVSLADTLRAERREGNGVTIEVTGENAGPDRDNLAARAAAMVLEATGHRFAIHLSLTKRIPAGAGLGGGSADAAAALTLANHLAGGAVPRHELLQFAARLGSDVPFCFSGAALALGWGHGERLFRLPALPGATGLLLVPPIAIRTADAYGWVDGTRQGDRRGAVTLDIDVLSRWGDVGRMAGNDFESPIFARYPAVRAAFDALIATGPLICRMSGSGSTLFAIYRSARDRDDARMMLGRKHGTLTDIDTAVHAAEGVTPAT